MANKISVIIDVAVDQANRSLKSFRQSVSEADGAAGKFKAGASSAFAGVQANAGMLATAAGAALVTFGVKAVGAFQDTALQAGKLRDSLGLTAEEASQFMEVAGDLGIPVGTFEASIGKMNQTMARTPQLFADLGIEMAKNADGTDNVRQNFLNTIDALNGIPNATARADAAQRIFGRNWREISEMIGRGSKELVQNLEDVGDAKVIDDEEVDRARAFRDTMDELGDKGEEALTAIGGELVPVVGLLAEAVTKTIGWVQALRDVGGGKSGDNFFGNLYDQAGWFVENIKTGRTPWEAFGAQTDKNAESIKRAGDFFDAGASALKDLARETSNAVLESRLLADATDDATNSFGASEEAIENASEALEKHHREADLATESLRKLRDEMSDRSGFLEIQNSFDDLQAIGLEALDAIANKTVDAEQKSRDYELAQIALTEQVMDYADEVGNIPPEAVSRIVSLIDQGKLEEAEAALANLMRPRTTTGTIIIKGGGNPKGSVGGIDGDPATPFHTGGIVGQGHFRSDEVPAVLQKGEMVLTEGQQAAVSAAMSGGSGATFNVTINADPNPDVTVRKLREWVRRNGPIQGLT